MNTDQHGLLVAENGEFICSTTFNSTPAELRYAMERNNHHNCKEYILIDNSEEHSSVLAVKIMNLVDGLAKQFGKKQGIPMSDHDFRAQTEVAITHLLVHQ